VAQQKAQDKAEQAEIVLSRYRELLVLVAQNLHSRLLQLLHVMFWRPIAVAEIQLDQVAEADQEGRAGLIRLDVKAKQNGS
jgi:hypothetical protein